MIKVKRNVSPPPSSLLARARNTREDFFRENENRLAQIRVPKPDSIALRYLLKPLRRNFEDKCGFCEQQAQDGVLAHFRPYAVHDIGESTSSSHLHYSWLAYDWDNLVYCCSVCSIAKGAIFPVHGSRASFGSSVGKCRAEEDAHLLDPTFDEPSDHLRFDINGSCLSLSERGGRTISLLNLNRSNLVDRRRDLIKALWIVFSEGMRVAKEQKIPNAAIVSSLLGFTSNKAEFSGVAQSVLMTWIREYPEVTWVSELLEQMIWQGSYKGVDLSNFRKNHKETTKIDQKKAVGRRRLPTFAGDLLTRVELENFKGIGRADFDLALPLSGGESDVQASCLVLLGENSVGKSTVLEAISLALTGAKNLAKLNVSASKYLQREDGWKEAKKDGWVRLFFNQRSEPDVVLKINSATKEFELVERKLVVLAAYGPGRSYIEGRTSLGNRSSTSISSLFNYFAFLDDPRFWLIDTAPDDFNAAVRALREIVMLQETTVDFVKDHYNGSLDIFVGTNKDKIPLNFMSDGYRTVIAMATDIIRHMLKYYSNLESARGIVIIDEIDTHLHPRWKLEILKRLRMAFPQIQFIVSTHDPLCLRGAKDREVAVLKKVGSTTEVITELPNVEALSIEQLLTSDYFGLLSTDDPIMERRKERHLELTGMKNRTSEEEEELKNVRTHLLSKMQFGQTDESRLLYEAVTEYLREKKSAHSSIEKLSSKTIGKMLSILRSGSD